MGFAQRELFAPPQADLFGAAEASPASGRPGAYTPKPEHVRAGLIEALALLRASERWPWSGSWLKLQRESTWPYLIRLLPDRDEAERWRADLALEAARLDAAAEG